MNHFPNTITSISVSGFKSIGDEQRITIRPLTVLVGANSSGKSSIMQALLLLKQTLESQTEPEGALLLNGQNARFTSAGLMLHKRTGHDEVSAFMIRLVGSMDQKLELHYQSKKGGGFDIREMRFEQKDKKVSLQPRMTHEQILSSIPKEISIVIPLWESLSESSNMQEFFKSQEWAVYQNRCFLDLTLLPKEVRDRSSEFKGVNASLGSDFIPIISGVIHLPGLRGNPERSYPKISSGPKYPGTFEQYTASIIAQWKKEKHENLHVLGNMLESVGLTWKVDIKPITEAQLELLVARLPHAQKGGARDLINITDVGFGVSQTLPVLVALVTANSGQMVYLEQPEIHLHPKAQRGLAKVILQALNRGVVAIIETHSSILLREIQTLIAQGKLQKEDVALHWFERDSDGATTVTIAELDDDGTFGNWPTDFDDVELQSETDYLNAVENRKSH